MDRKQIFSFIESCKTAFIASVDADGFPNLKAMLAPRAIEGNSLYFTTNTSSMRVGQYLANEKASVYFYKRGRFTYEGVMLIGVMRVLTDQAAKDKIWRPGDRLYYKGGVTDPDYCVLRFDATACRHYRDFHSEWIGLEV